jgi:hypothetical protein
MSYTIQDFNTKAIKTIATTESGGEQIQKVELSAGDIQIGAVELKDGTTDTRAAVGANGLAVDVKASVLPTGAATQTTLAALNDKVTSCNTGAVVLAAGSAAIGKLAANSGVDIGDVDILSIAAGTNLIGKVSIDQVTANANEVVVKSSALPTGAATEATLTTIDADTGNISSYASRLLSSANAIGAANTLATTAFAVTGQYNATPPTLTDTQSCGAQMDTAGNFKFNLATSVPAGTNVIGQVGIDQTTDGTTNKVQAHLNVAAAALSVSNPAPVQSPGFVSSVSKTRPDNATPYTALDVVGTDAATNMEFTGIGSVAGGHVIITGISMRCDVNAVPSGMSSFRLHLYDAAPTAIADNTAYNLPSGDRDKYLGYIEVATPIDLGDTIFARTDNLNYKVKLAAASTTLYGLLQTVGAYTPTAQAVKTVKLHGIQC